MNVAHTNPTPSPTPDPATPASNTSPSPAQPASAGSTHYPLLPTGPSAEAFHDLKTSIHGLHAVVRRWGSRQKSLQEPIKGALQDVIALDEQLHALWVHLDRVLRDLPPAVRGERSAWRRPRHAFPDLTGEFPRSVRDQLKADLEA